MKIYIAGPMTGREQWNFPAFFEAEAQLLALGYDVVNPAHNDGATLEAALASAGSAEKPNHTWGWYMRRDLPHVMGCDAICLLEGWRESRGALLEVHVAEALGMPVFVLRGGKLVPRVRVIGLSGVARSGKDTVADYICDTYGYKKMSFADPIREALYKLNPDVTVNGLAGSKLRTAVDVFGWEDCKDKVPQVRPLLQNLGTEVGRNMFGENFWVSKALNSVEDGTSVVFADVRFPNEANAIRALNGLVIRIEREGYTAVNGHISETALDDYEHFDAVLQNDSTLGHLMLDVDNVIRNRSLALGG